MEWKGNRALEIEIERTPATRYPPPVTLDPPPVIRHPPPTTHYPPPATRHPPPATRHPPPVTRNPPPATRHPPPVEKTCRKPSTYLYTWMGRGTVREKCLAQEHSTMSQERAQTRTAHSRVEHTNHMKATVPFEPYLDCQLFFTYGKQKLLS